MKGKRTVSLLLALVFLLSSCFSLNFTVFADGEVNYGVWHDTSAIEYDTNSDEINDTAKVTMEAYATSPLHFSTDSHTVGCDITIIFDQSKAMNAHREDIINAANDLVNTLPAPADPNDEHRIAIAGYGRLNNPGDSDPTSGYAGVRRTAQAYNSGVYSYDNGTIGFYTQNNGFTFQNDGTPDTVDSQGNIVTPGVLPSLPMTNDISYDDVFLTQEDAKAILTSQNMNMWNSGGCRMDVGMRIVQELNRLSANHNSNRPQLLVMFAAGNPIQNYGSSYTSRLGAVNEALSSLIDSGMFCYTLGDWGPINNSSYDTAEHFEESMLNIAASPYHYISVTNSTNEEREERLEKLIEVVDQGVANIELLQTVNVTATTDDVNMNFDISLLEALYDFDDTHAVMKMYPFKEYDEDGNPVFFENAKITKTVSVTETTNSLSYTCEINTIPTYDFYTYVPYPNGYKVVVEVLGTRQAESVGVSTRCDKAHFNAGSVSITDGSTTLPLTQQSTGIYTYTGFLTRSTDYTILVDGEPVKRADGSDYTIRAGESQILDWYSVTFCNSDGSSYSNGAYDYDNVHRDYVIDGTVLSNDTGKSGWYTSPTDHSSKTKFSFSTPITSSKTLYWDNSFTFSYYTAFNYKEPWEISCYGALKYNGQYINAETDSNVSDYKMYVYRGSLNEKAPDMERMKTSWKTTVYDNAEDFTSTVIGGVSRYGVAYDDIYIYQMKNPVYIAFEVTYNGITYTSSIKDRSMYNINETYISEASSGNYTTFNNRQLSVLTKMKDLYTAVSAIVTSNNDAPSYPAGVPVESLPTENKNNYSFTPSATIRNIEPWGYKFEAVVSGGSLSDLTDFGVLVCRNKDAESMTLSEILSNENTLQYSYSTDNIFYQGNTVTSYYFDNIYSTSIQENVFVVFYAANGSGYSYSAVNKYNYDDIAEAQGASEWAGISEAIRDFAEAVRVYEGK